MIVDLVAEGEALLQELFSAAGIHADALGVGGHGLLPKDPGGMMQEPCSYHHDRGITLLVHPVNQILCIDIALRGGGFQPAQGFSLILRDLPTLQITLAESVLGVGIPLLRSLLEPCEAGVHRPSG